MPLQVSMRRTHARATMRPVRPNAYESYASACAFERAAWELVKDRLPGTAGHDPALWADWRQAVRQADEALQAVTSLVLRRGAPPASAPPPEEVTAEPPRSIQSGDVVRLRAGGAPMNVRSVTEQNAMCTWFELDGQRRVDVFDLADLELLHHLPEDDGRDRSGGIRATRVAC
ncbi:MAG: DUF2158 domain-containing protein [Comamonadaceae bacterium]|nr:MAG: DUF2158 domain-containing protein [Comamonadaceae bacterium]